MIVILSSFVIAACTIPLASLLAITIIYLMLPLYNSVSGKQLVFDPYDKNIWLVIGSAVTGTLILASIYPALLLTSFKPLQVLKGKLSIGIGTTSFRKKHDPCIKDATCSR